MDTSRPLSRESMDSVFWKRNFWSGLLFGIGLIAFIDEAVFHQLLHWHHFYDRATRSIGLCLRRAVSCLQLVCDGLVIVLAGRSSPAPCLAEKRWWGSVVLGAGLFQLYDGIIQHKWMRIHQIRYVENVLIYDLVWNLLAVIMIIAGFLVIRSQKKRKEREA